MATVYLAQDVRHDRKVALKVLRPELAEALGHERFLREIETTANLRHPHILPLYDSGEAASSLFYVMPYLEGETLRERIDREKQLPIDDAVDIATAVAAAAGDSVYQGHLLPGAEYLRLSRALLRHSGPRLRHVWLSISGAIARVPISASSGGTLSSSMTSPPEISWPALAGLGLTAPADSPVEVAVAAIEWGAYLGEDDIERFEDDYGRV